MAEPYLHTKWHLDAFSHLATIEMGRKLEGALPPFADGSWVPVLYNVAWTEAHLHDKCHRDPSSHLATIDMGEKLGAPPFLRRGAGSPSNTKSAGPKPTFIPSGILIHPAIWPQQIWAES